MSNPVLENIALNIKSTVNALDGITALRPRRVDFSDITPKDLDVLIKAGDPIDDKENTPVGNFKQWIQPYALMAIVLDDDDESASIETRLNLVRSNIEKAIMVDITRGGYAQNTELMEPAEFDDNAGFSGISVNIAVIYRTKGDDPFTQT